MPKKMLSFRVSPEMLGAVNQRCAEEVEAGRFKNRNQVLEKVMEDWLGNRYIPMPDAFPAEVEGKELRSSFVDFMVAIHKIMEGEPGSARNPFLICPPSSREEQ
jgi:hypothetical protein